MDTPNTQPIIEIRNVSMCFNLASEKHESLKEYFLAMIQALPAGANWSAFGIGRDEFPMVAHAMLAGGNCRVGLEDNIYLDKGVYATNAQLVDKAVSLIRSLGGKVLTPAQAREKWGL